MSNTGPESTVRPAAQTAAEAPVDSTRRQRGGEAEQTAATAGGGLHTQAACPAGAAAAQERRSTRLMTPHPIPNRFAPTIAGGAVVGLALPVFLLVGWDVAGWLLGAVLWIVAQALGLVLTRLRMGMDNLAGSSVVGLGMMFRPVAVMVVAVAVAASNAELGVAAALVYALAYTLELGVSLALYFGSPAQR
jgi:hypothetical protein